MKRILYLTISLVLLTSVTALAGCAGANKDNKDMVAGTGFVKFIDLEGGFYGIVGDDGKNYDPTNLAQAFQEDGLRIRFRIKILKDVATIRMWGTPVELIKIEKLR